MKSPFFIAAVGIMLIVAQFLLWGAIVLFQLPGAQSELILKVKAEMPEKIVPVILAYYPEVNSITYASAVGYCPHRETLQMNIEAEGITEDYVCGLIDDGLVTNTEELRVYLARKVVGQKADALMVEYSGHLLQASNLAIIIGAISILLAVLAFSVAYFGSNDILKGIFQYSVLSGMWGFSNMVLSALCILLVPGLAVDAAYAQVGGGIERDVLGLMKNSIRDTVGGIFVAPMLVFGAIAFSFAVLAAVIYVMDMNSKEK